MMPQTLLVELLAEELPPRSLPLLSRAFGEGLADALKLGRYLTPESQMRCYATPRRLAVTISHVLGESPAREVRDKILPVAIALDPTGAPSAALKKKLAALKLHDVDVAGFERAEDGKAESFYYTHQVPGQTLQVGLGRVLPETIAKLPVAKMMRYQLHVGRSDQETVQFARPARQLLVLWGETILAVGALGLNAIGATRGHRFLAPASIKIDHADDYVRQLHETGRVIPSFEERRDAIREQLLRAADGMNVLMPDTLLDEVTALVEWPVVYVGQFDPAFLVVPQECLVLTMQQNQRYFALTDAKGAIQNRFLLVSNIETADPQAIIAGNERVLRARLADAKFFFEQDEKKSLAARVPLLDKMVYHHVLGSLGNRVRRLATIATGIAAQLGVSVELTERAALLSKTDLVTDMVGEFPELQGIMGRYYAEHDGEDRSVASAIEEHYRPRFAGDRLPQAPVSICVALADKLEIVVGMFAVANVPTGDRDPYALRRHALGIVRILMEHRLALDLPELLEQTFASFAGIAGLKKDASQVYEFLLERLRSLLKDQSYTNAEIEAVVSLAPVRIAMLPEQLHAVRMFSQMPEAASLSAANKRIGNILKKTDARATSFDRRLLVEPAEAMLAARLSEIEPKALLEFEACDYTEMLKSLAGLRDPVDAFFDNVMVMSEDLTVRQNRIALLDRLYRLMNRFADLSKLAG